MGPAPSSATPPRISRTPPRRQAEPQASSPHPVNLKQGCGVITAELCPRLALAEDERQSDTITYGIEIQEVLMDQASL